jgi:cardiolipin synthase A/B
MKPWRSIVNARSERLPARSRFLRTVFAFASLLESVVLVGAAPGLGAPALAAPAAVGAPEYRLVTEPADGPGPIYSLILSARHTLDMTMYELRDPTAEADLVADAGRGVKVRVVLDHNLAGPYNAAAYRYLESHGVAVHWAPQSYDVTHQKTITVDGAVSAVMTLNLTSEYYSTTRDFVVVDRDPADVSAIEAVFNNDFAGRSSSPEPAGAHLVWSPGADARVVGIIGSANHTLYVENEEMSEYTVVDALCAAARRGVDVKVAMTYQSSWSQNFDKLVAAGVHVSTYAPSARLYIHAKVIDVDPGYPDEQLDLGSQNFSWTSLQYNRELGVDLGPAQANIVNGVAATVGSDFTGATPWRP